MNTNSLCPYPTCGKLVGPADLPGACGCDSRHGVLNCASCGMTNRVGGRYCRSCRSLMGAGKAQSLSGKARNADLLSMQGCFRRPPLVAGGELYAMDTGGRILGISPRAGAKAREIARLRFPAACFNRGAAVDVTDPLGAVRGWTFLGVSPAGVEATSLASGKVVALYEAKADEEILANGSEADSTGLKGLVAGSDFCAFAVRISPREIALTLRYFSNQHSIAQPLKIGGSKLVGPAMCQGVIVLCSEEEVGLYDSGSNQVFRQPLPSNFRPMLRRENFGISVPPGGMSLVGLNGPSGSEAWIGGYQVEKIRGRESLTAGLLHVQFDEHRSTFRDLSDSQPVGLSTTSDGSLVLSTEDSIEVLGGSSPLEQQGRRVPGMPVSVEGGYLTRFVPATERGWHQITVSSAGQQVDAYFEDAAQLCNPDSCCGVFPFGRDVVVPYLDISSDPQQSGLKFAHWYFAQ